MAVYINEGHTPADGGKPWKHLNGSCPRLLELEREGYSKKRVKNVDHKKPAALHLRRRCPVCFEEPEGLNLPEPAWLRKADKMEREKMKGTYWVYNLHDPKLKDAQVGMASNLASRLRSRWKATCSAGFVPDAIPWLYERLKASKAYQPRLDVESFPSRASALAAERELRERLREKQWNVSSDV
jgi:hypothetical protein